MQSIHGLAVHSPESNKSSRVEFDGFGTVANAKHPWLGYTHVLNPTKAAGGVWWIWYSSKCKASMAWQCTVLNPTKAAGGVWWFGTHGYMLYHWAILWSTESNKAAGGVWWIWYTWLHALFDGLYCGSTESNKSSRWSLMDLVHMATCSVCWAMLWSTDPSKSGKTRRRILEDFGS